MLASILKSILGYLRSPAARSAEEFGDDIEAEIAFHLDARAREYMQSGMSEPDARRAAIQQFGNPAQIAVECHAGDIGRLVLWHRLHLALTVGLVLAVAWLWFGTARSIDVQRLVASHVPPGIASMLDNDWTGDVTGRIVDERGRPIENAHVLAVVKTWPDQSYFQRAYTAVSDSQGKFVIQDVHPVNERFQVQVAAVADGRALTSEYHSARNGTLPPIVLRLAPSSGFAVQIESENGARLPDVELLPQGRVAANGTEHVVYFDSAQGLVRRADDAGRAELPYFQTGDTANFLVRTAKGKWMSQDVKVPAAGEVVKIRLPSSATERSKES